MSSINRKMANLITSTGDVASSALDNAASMEVFSSVDSLPTSGLSAGNQALVGQRLYISNGSGWYNVALINATPRLTLSQDGTIVLDNTGTATTITLTAADSDNSDANLTLTAESGGDFFKMATVSQDSSVFTITARSKDSATALGFDGSSTLTFKASDGIAFASNQVTFTLSFKITNSSYTSILLKADAASNDNQVDASTNTHTITEAGDVMSTSHSPHHPGGYSVDFDGNGDALQFTATSDFSLSGDFTIEAWVYLRSITLDTQHPNLLILGTTQLYFDSSNNYIAFYHGGSNIVQTANSSITKYKWHHVAVTRSGTAIKLFLNGALAASATASTTYGTSSGTQYIGSYNGSGGDLDGYVRDLRVVNGTAVYTSAFDVPTSALTAITNTKLLVCHLPYIADGSADKLTITLAGAPETIRISPYDMSESYSKTSHGGSVFFDGSGDYLTTPSDAGFTYGTGDFTIECWVYLVTSPGGSYRYVLGQGANTNDGCGIYVQGNNYKFWAAGAAVLDGTASGTQWRLNVWQHVAVSRSGSTIKLFVDGVQAASATNSSNIQTGSSHGISIGRWHEINDNGLWVGFISDVRAVKGTAVYTSGFTPPTSPLTAITNTQLLTCTNKHFIWDAASGANNGLSGNSGFTNSSVTASNTQRKFTDSSALYYAGTYGRTVHYLDTPLYTGDFTVEGWIWFNAVNVADGIFHLAAAGLANSSNGLGLGIQSNGSYRMYLNGTHHTSTTTANAQTWEHFAIVRENLVVTLFINGNATNQANISNSDSQHNFTETYLHTGVWYGVWPANYDLTGYIQDFRLTRGLARYAVGSNFTPPTSLFTG